MSDTVIRVENLCKQYRLGQQQVHDTFRERLTGLGAGAVRALTRPFRRVAAPPVNGDGESGGLFWALKDVSFEVKRGEVLGIIGPNGAGKSTLLKVLSRITEPTTGEVRIEGRVASLLEVGTGFHPELTGRENVYLNGAILGMSRAEIQRKFDEIVAFAEVAKFIDTPVKHYSSGMYLRLAFAVAAHLEPEILIVDEVLAVGDVGFQNKCLDKMREVAKGGRTVLLVSHNLASIAALCPQSIWLKQGTVREVAATSRVISAYISEGGALACHADTILAVKPEQPFQLRRVRLINPEGRPATDFSCDEPVEIELLMHVRRRVPGLYAYLELVREDGITVLVSDSFDSRPNPLDGLQEGFHRVRLQLPARSVGAASYTLYLNFTSRFADRVNVDSPGRVCRFRLTDQTSRRGNDRGGFFSTLLTWHVEPVEAPSDLAVQSSNA